jgi:sulfoxide reductase heme-binding subunit YedZ
MTAVVETPADWYLLRGSGLVALVLFSLAVALGVVGVRRWRSVRWPRAVTAGLHRSMALLAVCFLGLHIVTAVLDRWVGLGWVDAVVPFRSKAMPLWVGLGTVAFDLAVAVVLTSLLRRHLGYRLWRTVHWGAWLVWPLALAHGLGSGTDTGSGWGLGVAVACLALVASAAVWRVAGDRGDRRRAAPAGHAPRVGPRTARAIIAAPTAPPVTNHTTDRRPAVGATSGRTS